GLIAPEPFVPPEATPQTAVAEVEEKAQTAEPSVALREGETVIDVNVESGEAADRGSSAGASEGGAGGAGYFAGLPLDRAIFGAAMIPAAAIMLRGNDDDDIVTAPPAAAASSEPTPASEEATVVDLPTPVEEVAAVDPDVADL